MQNVIHFDKLKETTQLQSEAQKSEAELKAKRSEELQALDTQVAARTTDLAKAQEDITQVLSSLTAQQAALGKTTEEAKSRETALAKLAADEASTAQKLAALQQQAEAAKRKP